MPRKQVLRKQQNRFALSREQLIEKLRNKKTQLKQKNQQISKKELKKTEELLKGETKYQIVNEKILTYYTSAKYKNKDILKPSELIENNNSELKLTSEILELYYIVVLSYSDIKIPLPYEINNNKDIFKNTYLKYLNNFFEKIKDLSEVEKMREIKEIYKNYYCVYLTKCLNIDINPFEILK